MAKGYEIRAEEQGWLDSFNNYFDYQYKNNGHVLDSDFEQVRDNINYFNNMVAHGEAIELWEN
ncbi:hypothetical protein [Leuconostoc aquikimchii]|uniref:Uncharacterized protein n=2 Tax=Leuconostoc aquikimchii TaxID=3236804 RepID=A0ABV3S203_9LACO